MDLRMPKSPAFELKYCKLLAQVQPNKRCYSSVIPENKPNLTFAYVKFNYFFYK